MAQNFGQITLTKKDLETANEILEKGCSGEVTFVFSEAVKSTSQAETLTSEGFTIEPKVVHCLYGCKPTTAIREAMLTQKGVLSEKNC
jgi:hypothetical protein